MLILLGAVFIIAVVWEFLVEDYLHSIAGEASESSAEKWNYISTALMFVTMALILPLYLGLKFIGQHEETSLQIKQHEKKIDEERAFLLLVLESLPYPFYVIDAKDYHVRLANSAAKSLANEGWTTCYKMTHGRDEPCNTTEHPCPMKITLETGKPTTVEHIHLDKAGNQYFAEVHSHPIFDKAGELESVIEYSIDITQRKQARNKLEETLDLQTVLYKIAAESIQDQNVESLCRSIETILSTIMDTTNFYIALGNAESGKLEFPYYSDEEDEAPGIVDFGNGMTEWVINTGKSLFASKEDILGMHARGDIELLGTPPLVWMGAPLCINGQIVGAVVVQTYREKQIYTADKLKTLEFVSTQIAQTITRKQTQDDLKKVKTLLSAMMQNTIDRIYFKDVESRFIQISNSQAKLFGLSDPIHAVGKSDFDFFTEEHSRKTFDEEQDIIRTNKPLVSVDEHLILKDKPDIWVSTTKLPLQDEAGNILGTFGITREITQNKLAEQALVESNNLKELLLDTITHDLRNPAGVIYSLADMAQSKQPNDEIINAIFVSSASLLKVLNNTTALAQATLGEPISLEQLNLHKLVTELHPEFSQLLLAADMKLEINIAPELMIMANPLIAEIFKNYISNAIKYAKSGKKIIVEALLESDAVLISVKDFGTTIAEADRERVFERSVQLEEGQKRGRGLGLAIVKRIAVAHGGEAWVEPHEPQGNSFCIRIPC